MFIDFIPFWEIAKAQDVSIVARNIQASSNLLTIIPLSFFVCLMIGRVFVVSSLNDTLVYFCQIMSRNIEKLKFFFSYKKV
jgi:hypothetical protein